MVIQKLKLFNIFKVVILLSVALFAKQASAQYFVSETNPMIKWSKIEFDNQYVVFPKENPYIGLTVSKYLQLLKGPVTVGLNPNLSKFPVLINTQNILSNGLVTWTPSRMELYGVPARNTFATQWLKQLTTHEFRHVAQMSTMNVGFTKALSYVIGQQAQGLVSALLPTLYLEGDAVLTETMYSTFGRGRQPEFTIALRALMDDDVTIYDRKDKKKFNYNRVSLGSVADFIPSRYVSGYLFTSSVERRLGADFWSKTLNYTGRNPFFFFTIDISFKKFGKTKFDDEFQLSLIELSRYWKQFSKVDDSATSIPTQLTSYSTYEDPLPLNDSLIVSLKKDMDKTIRFVTINPKSAEENDLFYTGYVTSRPIIKESKLYWTEYNPSLSWGNKNSSVVKSISLYFNKKGKVKHTKESEIKVTEEGVFYVTALGDRGFAMISYNKTNTPELIITDTEFNITARHTQNWFDASFNGLTWDDKTNKIYGIVLNHDGMWIGAFNDSTKIFDKVTKPSYVTLNHLSASGGKLLFSSIASGKDEAHIMDLTTKEEYQITESKYGSVASSFASIWSQRTDIDSTLLLTTYSRQGYLPSTQKASIKEKVEYSYTPKDFLSYKFDSTKLAREKIGQIINLDTVRVDSSIVNEFKIDKYRKTRHLFVPHSWSPIYVSISRLMDESKILVGAGANMMSQSLLSDFTSIATLGYAKKMFAANAMLTYTGLPVHISASVDYGGGYQNSILYDSSEAQPVTLDKYLAIKGGLSLPLNLSSGVNNRSLVLATEISYVNSLLQNTNGYKEGFGKLSFNASYSSFKSRTIKQLGSRLGYSVQAYTSLNPFRNDFGTVYGVAARGYFPGFMRNHSLQIAAGYQYQHEDQYNYTQKGLFPMGAYNNFTAKEVASVQGSYQVPLAYPDWGIGPIVYFKRISLRLIGDYSYVTPTKAYDLIGLPNHFYTYGAGLDFYVHFFRIGTPMTIGFVLYDTNTVDGMGVSFNFGIDF